MKDQPDFFDEPVKEDARAIVASKVDEWQVGWRLLMEMRPKEPACFACGALAMDVPLRHRLYGCYLCINCEKLT